jgi:hypothetical protein
MTRIQIIKKLMSEGFSGKTLANFNDKQLLKLSNKILGEDFKVNADDLKNNPDFANKIKGISTEKGQEVTVVPEGKNKETEHKKGKPVGVKKNVTGKDVVKSKNLTDKKAKGPLNIKKLNDFVENVVDKKYHAIATKGEISELIKEKFGTFEKKNFMAKIPEFIEEFEMGEPAVKPAPTKPDVDTPRRQKPWHPGRRPSDPDGNPLPFPPAKARSIREFKMTEPAVKPAPTKPDVDTPKRQKPWHPGRRPSDPDGNPLPFPPAKAGDKTKISGDEAKTKIIGMIHDIFTKN